jgi:hypothetical protein
MKTAIVFSLDKVFLQEWGCYGGTTGKTPCLDSFACESTVFDLHFAENTDPQAIGNAWWSGRYQFPRVDDNQDVNQETFADLMRTNGVTTTLIDEEAKNLSEISGVVDSAIHEIENQREKETQAGKQRELIWLKAKGIDPDSIPPNEVISDLAEELSEENAAIQETVEQPSELELIDREFGRLWESLQQLANRDDELLVIVTAAEGISTDGQPHLPDEFRRLGEETVHTPLIVFSSDGESATRCRALSQPVDLLPTLLDWFSQPALEKMDGRSLLPWVRGEKDEDVANVERPVVFFGMENSATGIRTQDDLLLATLEAVQATESHGELNEDSVMLFVKPDDSREIHNVAPQNPDRTSDLLSQLRVFLDSQNL